MFKNYNIYRNEMFQQLVEEASSISKQLSTDIQVMNTYYLYNAEERILRRRRELMADYPKSKEALYQHAIIQFFYDRMDERHKAIFDHFVNMLEDRIVLNRLGNVRSYKTTDYYIEIEGIYRFALSCVYMNRLNLDVVSHLKGKSYFTDDLGYDFIEPGYYAACINMDDEVLDALSSMIYDNEGLIHFSNNIIKGMLLSDCERAHDMIMDVLASAARSEGLRQSIVEAIDFAKLDVYTRFLSYIHENNLIRFSSVKRAFMCYTGIEGMVEEKKAKILEEGIYHCLVNHQQVTYLQSESALDLYIGLYAMATERLENALNYIGRMILEVEDYKKAVMILFIRRCDRKIRFEYIENLLETITNEQLMGSLLTEIGGQIVFDSNEQKITYIQLLSKRLDSMKKNVGSYGILDEASKQTIHLNQTVNHMITLCDDIQDGYEYAYKHLNRISYIHKIHNINHPFVRHEVIKLIGSNTENHRRVAYDTIIKEGIELTHEEYKELAIFLKSKRSDTRKYVTTLFQKADPAIVIDCAADLIEDKNYQKRSGGLSILVENKERLIHHHQYERIRQLVDTHEFEVELKEEVSILKGDSFQTKEAQRLYDEDYEPQMHNITYDKRLIKQYLNPDEKKMVAFIKEVVSIYHTVLGREVELKRYNGSIEVETFGYGYFNSIRLNRPYGSREDISYQDYVFYEECIRLDALVESKDIELFQFYIGLMHNHIMGTSYYVERSRQTFEELTAHGYYPKLKTLRKYLKSLDEQKGPHYLESCLNVLDLLAYYKKERGTMTKVDYSYFFLNAYAYMTVLDEKARNSQNMGTAFDTRLLYMTLNEVNIKERGELVVQLMLHRERLNRDSSITFDYQYLFKFVELGYLPEDCIYKEFFDFKEFGGYSKTTNSRSIIQYVNHRARRNQATQLEQDTYNRSIDAMLEVELDRTEKDTLYSGSIHAANSFYGIEVFLKAIYKMGKMPFLRGYSWVKGGKKNIFSHIIYYCEPLESDTQEAFNEMVKGYKISDRKLLEAGMYNLKFIDYVTNYLGMEGLKKAAYYFKAHMKENFDEEDQVMIRRYTDLDFDDLHRGQMDIKWFMESYKELGEKNFTLLYECSKYITTGGNHKRAQYFADAVLGRLKEADVLEKIKDKRNQEMVLAYGLLPLGTHKMKDALKRYKTLQQFIKESKQFGAQRKASELTKATIAIQNLARTCGYVDVNRFIWAMEIEMATENSHYYTPETIDDIQVWLDVSQPENPHIAVEKNGNRLKSIPAKYNKTEYVKELKVVKKELKEQFSRTKKSFETAMIDEVLFDYEEILSLKEHPVIRHIIDKLLWSCGDFCGLLSEENQLVTFDGEVELSKTDTLRIVHPTRLLANNIWADWQNYIMEHEIVQPFKQVFREVYVMTAEEKVNDGYTNRFAGYQIEPKQTYGLLKSRDWVVNDYDGFEKINHSHDLRIDLYCYADWYTPSSIESPTLEKVEFIDNKTGKTKDMSQLAEVIFSEVMRDLDLVVSVAYIGGVDVAMNHSTIEMRQRILKYNLGLFKVENYSMEAYHIIVQGTYGKYSVHLGSGIIHMEGKGMLPVFPVHSQQRGHIFLPFVDDDPKTAEIMSKVLMLAKDNQIKDPSILKFIRQS